MHQEKVALLPPQLSFIEVFLLLEAVRVKTHLLHSPYAVEHISIFRNAQQLVVGGDLMEVGPLLIGEEQIRFPNGVQHGRVEVQRVVRVLAVGKPGVVPLLPQEDVDSVVLGNRGEESFCRCRTKPSIKFNRTWTIILGPR